MQDRDTGRAGRRRFELDDGDGVTFADCSLDGGTLSIWHVEAPVHLRGTGAAGRLMQQILERARHENWKVVPYCGYAAAWIRRHPEFRQIAER